MVTKKNERNEEIERILMDEEIRDYMEGNKAKRIETESNAIHMIEIMDAEAAEVKRLKTENRRLSEENKALKHILQRAVDDMQKLFDAGSDVCCSICDSDDCDYDTICRWRGESEALRLIGGEKL